MIGNIDWILIPYAAIFIINMNPLMKKIHKTYRYLFDRTKPFKRMPFIGEKKKKDESETGADLSQNPLYLGF